MKWDLKSIITLMLVSVLALVVLVLIASVVFGFLPSDDKLVNSIILLFSNSVTMILTYFFAKKKGSEES